MTFDYRTTLMQTADSLLEIGNVREAFFTLQRLIENFPDSVEYVCRFAKDLFRLGLISESKSILEVALRLSPNQPEASGSLAGLLTREGDFNRALTLIQSASQAHPDNAVLRAHLGQLLILQGRLDEAILSLRQSTALLPEDPELRVILGEAYFRKGETPLCMAALQRALLMDPEFGRAHFYLALAHQQTGNLEEAWKHIQIAFRSDASNPQFQATFMSILEQVKGPELPMKLKEVSTEGWHTQAITSPSAPFLIKNSGSDSREIVFVGDVPRTRQAKLALGLRRAGWRTVLLYTAPPNFDIDTCFDEAHRYQNEAEALALAHTYSPRAFHVFSVWSEKTSVALIRHKPGKVVYDSYDLVATIFDPYAEMEIPDQRFCLENADALCCRDMRHQILKQEMGYRLPKKIIFFQEYCWETEDTKPISNPFPEGEIHLVSSGSFSVEKLGQEDAGLLAFGELLARQGIHLHIFPSPLQLLSANRQFDFIFSDYLDLEKRTGYVHMHHPLSAEELAQELRRYSAAIHATHSLTYQIPLLRYHPKTMDYSTGARIFEYLEAELPLVLNKELVFTYRLMRRYGLGVDASPDNMNNLKAALISVLTPEAKQRAHQARADFSLDRQIPRLIRFYESL